MSKWERKRLTLGYRWEGLMPGVALGDSQNVRERAQRCRSARRCIRYWKSRHRLPEESFRQWLKDRYHVTSTGDLSGDQAAEVIKFLTIALTAILSVS